MNIKSSSDSEHPVRNSPHLGAVIKLEGVSISFRKYRDQFSPSLKGTIVNLFSQRQNNGVEKFWVYEELNLKIDAGERVGIIGRNGAGKSTLLQLIAGVYPPAHGRVHVIGSVTSLVQLGIGMAPELSGVENIFLVGSLLGYSPSTMIPQVEKILDFAELHDFSETPVKYYSSGMCQRLSFAIATATAFDDDILLMDEVFTSGDGKFVPIATARTKELIGTSQIVLFASHNLSIINEITTRTIWIDKGKIVRDGPSDEVCAAYKDSLKASAGH